MVQRFIEFHEPLLRYVNDDHEEGALQQDIAALLPSYEEVLEIKKLYKALKGFPRCKFVIAEGQREFDVSECSSFI